MKLFAHVRQDGSIESLVAAPEGDVQARLVPQPGVQICEIPDHGLGEDLDLERLLRMRDEYVVDVIPAEGTLRRKRDDAS